MRPTNERDIVAAATHRGPSLVAVAVVYTTLALARGCRALGRNRSYPDRRCNLTRSRGGES